MNIRTNPKIVRKSHFLLKNPMLNIVNTIIGNTFADKLIITGSNFSTDILYIKVKNIPVNIIEIINK